MIKSELRIAANMMSTPRNAIQMSSATLPASPRYPIVSIFVAPPRGETLQCEFSGSLLFVIVRRYTNGSILSVGVRLTVKQLEQTQASVIARHRYLEVLH
jgi:hypothetical protein